MNFLKTLLQPVSKDEDSIRREYILNILLLSCIFLTFIAFLIAIVRVDKYSINPFLLVLSAITLVIFGYLFYLSKKGHYKISSYAFLSIIFIINLFISYLWGTQAQVVILFYILIIIMSGILLSTKIAFFATIFSSISLSVFAYLQNIKILNPDLGWTMESAEIEDVIMFLIFFFIIAIISWLSNREIEKSLQKARESEAELKEERNNLELRVKERTKEIQKLQIEKMAQVYHFAELGRLSSGLFHDMINPIMAISLTIEQIKKTSENNNNLKIIENSVNKVKQANDKMQKLIDSIRKQMTQQGAEENFSINKEIIDAIELLSYKAKKGNIEIVFQNEREIKTIGDSVKFNQIITNIISNSIDSFQGKEQLKNSIEIELKEKNNGIRITIKDNGCGIPDEIKDKIFDPFFTTKNTRKGMGIGLFLVKEFIEKSLKGEINVKSKINKGTSTIIKFSSRKNNGNNKHYIKTRSKRTVS